MLNEIERMTRRTGIFTSKPATPIPTVYLGIIFYIHNQENHITPAPFVYMYAYVPP